jgi:hypothetical protein
VGAPVRALVVRGGAACAVLDEDDVRCWGANNGRFPLADERLRVPEPLRPLTRVRQIALGGSGACALVESGAQPLCWHGRAPTDPTGSHLATAPRPVAGLPALRELALADEDAYGIAEGGTLYRWPLATDAPPTRVDVPPLRGVAANSRHACGWDEHGDVWCWDASDHGEAGDAGDAGASDATRVPIPERVERVVVASDTSFAIVAGGRVYQWGTGQEASDPVVFDLPEPATELVAADAYGCARSVSGRVACWGHWRFDDVREGVELPTFVSDLERIEHLAGDDRGICASRGDSVWCWGGL